MPQRACVTRLDSVAVGVTDGWTDMDIATRASSRRQSRARPCWRGWPIFRGAAWGQLDKLVTTLMGAARTPWKRGLTASTSMIYDM
jgi:hypothetical protein